MGSNTESNTELRLELMREMEQIKRVFMTLVQMPMIVEQIDINDIFVTESFDETYDQKIKNDTKKLGSYRKIKETDKLVKNKETCSICLEPYAPKEYKRELPECKHVFHKRCCDRWLKKHSTCPICRENYEM